MTILQFKPTCKFFVEVINMRDFPKSPSNLALIRAIHTKDMDDKPASSCWQCKQHITKEHIYIMSRTIQNNLIQLAITDK